MVFEDSIVDLLLPSSVYLSIEGYILEFMTLVKRFFWMKVYRYLFRIIFIDKNRLGSSIRYYRITISLPWRHCKKKIIHASMQTNKII